MMTKKIILTIIFALAVFLITFHFTLTPKTWVDEGLFTEVARSIAFHSVIGLQTAPGQFFPMRNFLLSVSYPVIFPVALSLRIFGVGVWQARLPMLIYMLGLAIVFYLFTEKRYGFYTAILSLLMLLSFSPYYGNGRPVQGEVPGLFFLVLGALFCLYWEESGFKNNKWAALSGLAFGLGAAIKPIFLVGIPAALIISGIFFWKKNRQENRVDIVSSTRSVWMFIAGLAVPILVWMYIHLPTVVAWKSFFSTYLFFAGNHESSAPIAQVIIQNFLRFFTESTPILFTFLAVFVFFSFFFRLFRNQAIEKLSKVRLAELVVLSFIILNWVGYLAGTGWYRYFFPANTLLYLLFPAAMLALAAMQDRPLLKKILIAIPILLIIFQFTDLVFFSDTRLIHAAPDNQVTAAALAQIPSSSTVLFYGTVDSIISFKGENYSQYLAMEDYLVAGDKNAFATPTVDYILADSDSQAAHLATLCYIETPIARNFLFKKVLDCNK